MEQINVRWNTPFEKKWNTYLETIRQFSRSEDGTNTNDTEGYDLHQKENGLGFGTKDKNKNSGGGLPQELNQRWKTIREDGEVGKSILYTIPNGERVKKLYVLPQVKRYLIQLLKNGGNRHIVS